MAGVLVVVEHLRGQVRPVTLDLVSAAKDVGSPVTAVLIAKDPSALTGQVDVAGVDEIVTVAVEAEEFDNDVYQAALEAAIAEREPDAVLLGFTVNSMDFAPAVATKLELGYASDV